MVVEREFSVPNLSRPSATMTLADIEDSIEMQETADLKLTLDGLWVRHLQSSPIAPAGITIRKNTTVTIVNGRMDWGYMGEGACAFQVYGTLDLQGVHIRASGQPTIIHVHPGGRLRLYAVIFDLEGDDAMSLVLRGGSFEASSGSSLVGLDLGTALLPSHITECSITGPIKVAGTLNAAACHFLAGITICVTGTGKFVIESGEFHGEWADSSSENTIVVQGGGLMDINADFSDLESLLCATVSGQASKLLLRRSSGMEDVLTTRSEHGGQILCVR